MPKTSYLASFLLLSIFASTSLLSGTISVQSNTEGDQGKHIEKSISKDKQNTQSKETVHQKERKTEDAKSETKTSTSAREKSTNTANTKRTSQQTQITKHIPVTALLQDEIEYIQMLINLNMKPINAVLTDYQNVYHSLSMPLRDNEVSKFIDLATFLHLPPISTFKDPLSGREKFDIMQIPDYPEQELIISPGINVKSSNGKYFLVPASILNNNQMTTIADTASFTGRIITTDGAYYKTARFSKEGQLPAILSNENMPDTSSFLVTNFDYQNKYSGRINIKNDGETFNIKFLDTESSTNYEINPLAGIFQAKQKNYVITEYSTAANIATNERFTYKNDFLQNDIIITDNGLSSGVIGYPIHSSNGYAIIRLLWKYKEALNEVVKSGKAYSEAELLYKLRERAYCLTLDNECAEKFKVVYASKTDPFNPWTTNGFKVKSGNIFAKTIARQYNEKLDFSTYKNEVIFDKNAGTLFGEKFDIQIETADSIEKSYTELFKKSDTSAFASQIAKTITDLESRGESEKVDMLKTLAVRFAESKDFNMKKQEVLSVQTDSQIFSKLLNLVK